MNRLRAHVAGMTIGAGWLVVMLAGAAASAQLVTPPAQAPKKSEPFTMPPVPPPVAPPSPGAVNEGAPQPMPVDPRPAPPAPLPNLPYKSLVNKGPDGKLVALSEPTEHAALKVNPMVTDDARAKMGAALAARRERYENVVVTNLDLVEQLEGGVLDTLDVTKKEDLSRALSFLKPITPPAAPSTLVAELLKADLLTTDQKRFNEKITKEYMEAVQAELKTATPAGDNKAAMALPALRGLLRSAVDEPLFVRRLLMIELAETGAGLDSATAAKAKAALAAVPANATLAVKAGAVDKTMADMKVEQRKAALEAMLKARTKK